MGAPADTRPEQRPVVLFVSDVSDPYDILSRHLTTFDEGRLVTEFQFEHFDCFAALKDWYAEARGRFVSLIVQHVDFSRAPDESKLIGFPEVKAPVPRKFNPLTGQGFLVYAGVRQQNIDRVAPVLFVSGPGQLMSARRFADFIVYPGYGNCSFMEQSPDENEYASELAQHIDTLALRPLDAEKRNLWRDRHHMVIGRSRKMAYLVHEIERIGPSDAIALLLGQPGVGKELVANAVHRCSNRYAGDNPSRHYPHTVNIAALDKNLIEDELFGHERGAFTGASSERMGIFETARDSTVFLDEIGDISPEIQLKLLRAMEYHRIKRLGSSSEIRVDMRIIAATNRTVEDLRSSFRPDFYSRLVQHCIPVPSLRERWADEDDGIVEADLKELFGFVVGEMNKDPRHARDLQVERAAVKFLHQLVKEHIRDNNPVFHGNMRTLRNIIERAYERSQYDGSPEIRLGHIISTLGMIHLMNTRPAAPRVESIEQAVGSLNMRDIEKQAIVEAMEKCQANQTRAAEVLGIHRDTLRRKMTEYNL